MARFHSPLLPATAVALLALAALSSCVEPANDPLAAVLSETSAHDAATPAQPATPDQQSASDAATTPPTNPPATESPAPSSSAPPSGLRARAGDPPVLACPDDLLIDCDDGGQLSDIDAWLASASATSTCDDLLITHDFDGTLEACSATVTWTATDACGTDACSATVTVLDTTPPVLALLGDQTVDVQCGTAYHEPGALVTDACDPAVPVEIGGDTVDVGVPGTYVIRYAARDACGNDAPLLTRTVRVVDRKPPEAILRPMLLLWPPDLAIHTLTLADLVDLIDACEGQLKPDQVGAILEIYSDEPDQSNVSGDAFTIPDIVILSPTRFQVRAERRSTGNGRVYGVRFLVRDSAGNTLEALARIGVPLDRSGATPIDDGPEAGYSVSP